MYNLSVEVPGEQVATATCKVVHEIIPISLDTSSNEKKLQLKVSWKDDPSEENNYSLNGYYRSMKDTITTYGISWNVSKYYSIDINASDVLEGSQIVVDGTIAQSEAKTPIFVSLLNVDKNTFNFFDKRTKQYYQQQSLQQSIVDFVFHASSSGGKLSDVFERFKDPIILPNTIENGIGVFGSYSLIQWKILKK